MEMTNAKRAERGRRAYFAIEHDDNDTLTNIGDLISDLMHFADTIPVEGEEGGNNGLYVSGKAEYHYRAELKEVDAGRAFDLAEARFHGEDDIEIVGVVEAVDDGYWVSARVWIPEDEVEQIEQMANEVEEQLAEQLTPVGHAWALREASTSIVARAALGAADWPAQFQTLAVKLANAEGDANKLTIEERTLFLEMD